MAVVIFRVEYLQNCVLIELLMDFCLLKIYIKKFI